MKCKLCKNDSAEPLINNSKRTYLHCINCGLIFVPEEYWIDNEEEKKRYLLHNNSRKNLGYVKYLNQIVDIVKNIKQENKNILDFGSGKEAVLTDLLVDQGFECSAYDPLFGINLKNQNQQYDIVILCEVIEHLRDVLKELNFINSLLKKNGVLIIRTQLYPSIDTIENWWYTQDKTHINFFSKKSIDTAAQLLRRKRIDMLNEDIFTIR